MPKFRKRASNIADGTSSRGEKRGKHARASHRARGKEILARHGRVSSPRARWPFPGVRYGLIRGCGPVSRFPASRKSASGMAIWSSHLRTHHARLKRRLERETRGRSETRARIRDIDYTRSCFDVYYRPSTRTDARGGAFSSRCPHPFSRLRDGN